MLSSHWMPDALSVIDPPQIAWPGRRPPWPHQAEAFKHANGQGGFMLAIAMGGGKSAVAIAIADSTAAARILICCPKSVVGVWGPQLQEHSRRTWHLFAGTVQGARGQLANPSVQRRAGALQAAADDAVKLGKPFAAIVNYEAAAAAQMADALLSSDWDLIICDESHRIKAPAGKQSRFIGRLCQRSRRRDGRVLLLTGTPMPHSPLDLYGQFRALDPEILGTSNHAFKTRYGAPKVLRNTRARDPVYLRTPAGQLIYEGVRKDRLDELTARVAPYIYQVSQGELDRTLHLQDPVDLHFTCDLESPARRVYEQLRRELIAELSSGVVTAANAMVCVLRLAQVSSGFAVDADTGAHHPLSCPPEKARLLDDTLQDLDLREPVVVFARFHHDLNQIRGVCETQGRRYAELSGRDHSGLTTGATMRDDVDVLGVQPKAGGVGIDLTRARYGVFYSLDFALADYLQARKRLHRPGQQQRVTYIHLLANATVDHAIYGALKRRNEIVNAVLAHIDAGQSN